MSNGKNWMDGISLVEVTEPSDADCLTPPEKSIAMVDGIDPDRLLAMAIHGGFQQILQRSNPATGTDLLTSGLMLQSPELFRQFPVSSILDPQSAGAIRERELRRFDETVPDLKAKGKALDAMTRFISSVVVSRRFRYDCVLVADELCSNAVLNAPREGRFGRGGPSESGKEAAEAPRPARIFAAVSGSRLIVGCTDQYGSLEIHKMLSRVRNCYQCGPTQMINYGGGGAGIGSFLVFEACTGLYIAVKSGESTVVCCDFPMEGGGGSRARRAIPKNLHLIFP